MKQENILRLQYILLGMLAVFLALVASGIDAHAATFATTTCTHSVPVNLDGALAPDYEYSKSTCVTEEPFATTTINAIIEPTPMQDIFYAFLIWGMIVGGVIFFIRKFF